MYAKVLQVTDQASSHGMTYSSTRRRISSAIAIAGWVSFSCTANFSWKEPRGTFCTRRMRSMSCSEQETKKYCCSSRSSLPRSCSSFGYRTLERFRHRRSVLAVLV